MLFKKEGYPEENELVMCTVAKVQFNSVFVNLDEFQKQGMIHISEISPGRIRNIRDFVKEGKVVVCKVLRVNRERGQIDLSLRRVSEVQRRSKVEEMKQEQKAEKILEYLAKEVNKELSELYKEVFQKTAKKYPMLHYAFQAVAEGSESLENLGIEKKVAEVLTKEIVDRIKPSEVTIHGDLVLMSYEPNGVEIVRDAIRKSLINENIKIIYLGGGKYHLSVTAEDYPDAEELLKESSEKAIEYMQANKSEGSFIRQEQ
ncbi:MAG: translation initiation factor IF-2 subunit alpha [Candidatus Woesearchaeota archaeon]